MGPNVLLFTGMSERVWKRESSPKLAKTWLPLKRITKKLAWTPTRLKTQPMTVNIKAAHDLKPLLPKKQLYKTGLLSFYVFYPYYPHYDKCVKPNKKVLFRPKKKKKKKKKKS